MNAIPHSTDVTKEWEQLESDLDIKWEQLRKLDNSKVSLVEDVLKIFDTYLQRGDVDFAAQVFMRASNMLYEQFAPKRMWQWVRDRVLADFGTERMSALCIAVIEPASESAVHWNDLLEMMKFLEKEETTWALFIAYEREGFPENLLKDYLMYRTMVADDGREPIPFPYSLLADYLEDTNSRGLKCDDIGQAGPDDRGDDLP